MADFNIPDATGPETYAQECERVRPHIPAGLLPLYDAAVAADQGDPASEATGWPEMVATFLQLNPTRLMQCLTTMATFHLVRLGGSMMKIQSSTIVLAMARGDAVPFMADGFRQAKLEATLASAGLRGHAAMRPYVERVRELMTAADAASHLLADASHPQTPSNVPSSIDLDKRAVAAVELARCARGVLELFTGTAATHEDMAKHTHPRDIELGENEAGETTITEASVPGSVVNVFKTRAHELAKTAIEAGKELATYAAGDWLGGSDRPRVEELADRITRQAGSLVDGVDHIDKIVDGAQ